MALTERIQRDSACTGREAIPQRYANGKRSLLMDLWRIRPILLVFSHANVTTNGQKLTTPSE